MCQRVTEVEEVLPVRKKSIEDDSISNQEHQTTKSMSRRSTAGMTP